MIDDLGRPPERPGLMASVLLLIPDFGSLDFRADSGPVAPKPSLEFMLVELVGLDTLAEIIPDFEPVLDLLADNFGTIACLIEIVLFYSGSSVVAYLDLVSFEDPRKLLGIADAFNFNSSTSVYFLSD